jgi:quercetin dioxygenase-like cupin family protein
MINKKILLTTFITAILPVAAQAQAVTRTPMQTTEFPAGFQTVSAIATFQPAGCVGLHTHPGLETAYMLEGELMLKIEGKPEQRVKPGDTFQIPVAGKHDACNVGSGQAKLFIVYITEKGKPLASPAQ